MEDYISISTLNDFVFCPYSIYLHNVYMETDESVYHATPQTRGRIAHQTVDEKRTSNRSDELQSLPVISHIYGLTGKIDIYRGREKRLIERKYQLRTIYQGQIYQLWAQYLCMIEMGYEVESIAFYEISSNKMIPVELPSGEKLSQFEQFIKSYRNYDPSEPIMTNKNKCLHCIYCCLCDKTEEDNVYQ
ncbi:MAG: type V CRISPR-associated protein Cas4 [Bacteroidaceae bacterium]|nr:type V CRISPR-associated protein Cas4 [Bacteroidaceae bacterium]